MTTPRTRIRNVRAHLHRLAQAQTLMDAAKANREPTYDPNWRTVPTRQAINQVWRDNQGSLMRLWRQSGHSPQS